MGTVTKDKPFFVIFNPVAGINPKQKADVIRKGLTALGVKFEFYETKKQMDCFNKVNQLDFDLYAAVIISGGDGTIHEGLNGMMFRKDGKKLPVGLIPGGTGDDLCGNLGLDLGDINTGLQYISKFRTIKIDALKISIDDIPTKMEISEGLLNYMRYSFVNTGFCL